MKNDVNGLERQKKREAMLGRKRILERNFIIFLNEIMSLLTPNRCAWIRSGIRMFIISNVIEKLIFVEGKKKSVLLISSFGVTLNLDQFNNV